MQGPAANASPRIVDRVQEGVTVRLRLCFRPAFQRLRFLRMRVRMDGEVNGGLQGAMGDPLGA